MSHCWWNFIVQIMERELSKDYGKSSLWCFNLFPHTSSPLALLFFLWITDTALGIHCGLGCTAKTRYYYSTRLPFRHHLRGLNRNERFKRKQDVGGLLMAHPVEFLAASLDQHLTLSSAVIIPFPLVIILIILITDNNPHLLSLPFPGTVQDVPQPMTEEEERNTKRKWK